MIIILVFFNVVVAANYIMCDSQVYTLPCSDNYEPVCGIKNKGVPMTYPNHCHACLYAKSRYYLNEPCHTIINFCGTVRENCNSIKFEPSCAFYDNGMPQTIDNNKCCLNTLYSAYIEGPCPLMMRNNGNSLKFCV